MMMHEAKCGGGGGGGKSSPRPKKDDDKSSKFVGGDGDMALNPPKRPGRKPKKS